FRVPRPLDPDDHTHDHKRHRWQDHHVVVHVTCGIEPCSFRGITKKLVAHQRSGTGQLAEEGHHHQYPGITQRVPDAIQCAGAYFVAHGERLEAPHDDAVGDDQAHVHAHLLAHVIHVCLQYDIHKCYEAGGDHQLCNDPDPAGDHVAQGADRHVAQHEP